MDRLINWNFLPGGVRFLAVGALNTLFGYLVFATLLSIDLGYELAAFGATVLGIAFNFHSIGSLVFNNRDPRLLPRFLLVYSCNYLINIALLRAGEKMGINAYMCGAIVALPLALFSHLLFQRFVYKNVK